MNALAVAAMLLLTQLENKDTTVAVAAEVVKDGAPPVQVASGVTRSSHLSLDDALVVTLGAEGVSALDLETREARVLGPGADWVILSNDAKYVVTAGAPLTRYALQGKPNKVTLARGEALHSLAGLAMGRNRFAFTAADGSMVVTTLDEGTVTRLKVPTPRDARCHAGAGFPRAISDDDQWLLFQHGCSAHGLIRVDGRELRFVTSGRANLVGKYLVHSLEGGPLEWQTLDGKTSGSLETIKLSTFVKRVPGTEQLLLLNDGRLELADLAAKTSHVVLSAATPVSPFFDVSADGKTAFAVTTQKPTCEFFAIDLASGKKQRVLQLSGLQQCFIGGAGSGRAGVWAWSPTEARLFSVDVKSGVVKRRGPPMKAIGNFSSSSHALMVVADGALFLATVD